MNRRPGNRGRPTPAKAFISADTGEAYNTPIKAAPVAQQATPAATPVPAPVQTLKKEQATPQQQQPQQEPEQEFDNTENVEGNPFKDNDAELDVSGLVDENGKVKFKKIFAVRKKSSVRTREKRIRQNRRLRKTLVPKNALMALNELKGVSVGDFVINSNPNGGFIALVTCNNNQYEGRGISKTAAKNSACEKALRDYIIAKMRQRPRKISNGSNNPNAMDTSDADGNDPAAADETEDVPMVNLASFAIYKLFSEWESEGFVIPEMHPASAGGGGNISDNESMSGGAVKEPKKPPIRTELPPNWEAMHPASLLCFMRPGVTYQDKGTSGEKPNIMTTLAITVDNQEFEASGRSKKIARRNVAAIACNTLFNTNYDEEMKTE
ncbi:double-stranded RNA-specific editase 1 [Musca vetustissima]|uniref:double-stranded RNA-specific editase 1 n=1 Tax=Musca vetustissima TaxID=27455 RepID=UPI002AB69507|nr:double-stranded RNA-specific editase 1 [Musca vetustissima]